MSIFSLNYESRLAGLGNDVIITGRDPAKLQQANEACPALHTFACGLTRQEDLDDLVQYIEQTHPRRNVLINNASVQYSYLFDSELNALHKVD